MAENRLARELQARTTEVRSSDSWIEPDLLPLPAPQAGKRFRWIRVSIMGQADPMNISRQLRGGWEPVKGADHPEMMVYSEPTGRFKDNIENGGLLLCVMPEAKAKSREEQQNFKSKAQVEAVDNSFMKTNDPRMPLFNERKSTTTFGSGIK
jgi:hypothetical protein